MKNQKQAQSILCRFCLLGFVCLSFYGLSACSKLNQLAEDTTPTGSLADSTNDLTNSAARDFYLDALQLNHNISAGVITKDYARLEIHIMNADEESLLACVGTAGNEALDYMYDGMIYADMNAPFLVDETATLDGDTDIVVRLINKDTLSGSCPGGLDSEEGNPEYNDRVVSQISTTYGELFDGPIELGDYATAYFQTTTDNDASFAPAADTEGNVLSLNQLYLSEAEIDDSESSLPELALFLAPLGSHESIACAELSDIEVGSVLYAGLSEVFLDGEGNALTLDALDDATDYWLVLAEEDDVHCPSATALSGGHVDFIAYSEALTTADLLDDNIPLLDDLGFVNLYLGE